jgi:hypothetical protein
MWGNSKSMHSNFAYDTILWIEKIVYKCKACSLIVIRSCHVLFILHFNDKLIMMMYVLVSYIIIAEYSYLDFEYEY